MTWKIDGTEVGSEDDLIRRMYDGMRSDGAYLDDFISCMEKRHTVKGILALKPAESVREMLFWNWVRDMIRKDSEALERYGIKYEETAPPIDTEILGRMAGTFISVNSEAFLMDGYVYSLSPSRIYAASVRRKDGNPVIGCDFRVPSDSYIVIPSHAFLEGAKLSKDVSLKVGEDLKLRMSDGGEDLKLRMSDGTVQTSCEARVSGRKVCRPPDETMMDVDEWMKVDSRTLLDALNATMDAIGSENDTTVRFHTVSGELWIASKSKDRRFEMSLGCDSIPEVLRLVDDQMGWNYVCSILRKLVANMSGTVRLGFTRRGNLIVEMDMRELVLSVGIAPRIEA